MITMNTKVDKFGECTIPNPAGYEFYTKENSVVIYQSTFENPESMKNAFNENPIYFEQSGPLEKIYFNPS
ncbi:MAG TPA: ATP-dependent 6-phosphofructokinase, partial [Leptospiraceae bacterium]|nr:ATP-dependent 6-phosphofructokinase [Leptospiraceae bacterium]